MCTFLCTFLFFVASFFPTVLVLKCVESSSSVNICHIFPVLVGVSVVPVILMNTFTRFCRGTKDCLQARIPPGITGISLINNNYSTMKMIPAARMTRLASFVSIESRLSTQIPLAVPQAISINAHSAVCSVSRLFPLTPTTL